MEEQRVEEKILYISPAIQALITEYPNYESARLLAALTDQHGYKVQDFIDDPERRFQPGYVGCISEGMRGAPIEISEASRIAPVLRNILAHIDLEAARKIQKKILAISPAVRDLIDSTSAPAAVALLERLKKEQGYEVQGTTDYGTDKPGVIGHIVTVNNETLASVDYAINSVDGLVQVLSKLLSPANTNAPHSPPLERGFQQSGGEPPKPQQMSEGRAADNLLRSSREGKSIDGEEVVAGERDLTLTGLKSESRFANWCNWLPCCGRNEETNPLLSSEPGSRTPSVQKK